MTLYPFFKMAPTAILDLMWIMLDHTRSAIVGISSVLKFGFDPIYSFEDITIFLFCRFGWKLPIHAHLGEGFGAYFPPNDVSHRPNRQKALPYAETRRLSLYP